MAGSIYVKRLRYVCECGGDLFHVRFPDGAVLTACNHCEKGAAHDMAGSEAEIHCLRQLPQQLRDRLTPVLAAAIASGAQALMVPASQVPALNGSLPVTLADVGQVEFVGRNGGIKRGTPQSASTEQTITGSVLRSVTLLHTMGTETEVIVIPAHALSRESYVMVCKAMGARFD